MQEKRGECYFSISFTGRVYVPGVRVVYMCARSLLYHRTNVTFRSITVLRDLCKPIASMQAPAQGKRMLGWSGGGGAASHRHNRRNSEPASNTSIRATVKNARKVLLQFKLALMGKLQ